MIPAKKTKPKMAARMMMGDSFLFDNEKNGNMEGESKRKGGAVAGITPSHELKVEDMRPDTPYWWFHNRRFLFPNSMSHDNYAGGLYANLLGSSPEQGEGYQHLMDYVLKELPVGKIIDCMIKKYSSSLKGRRVLNEHYTDKARFIDLCDWVFADYNMEYPSDCAQYITICKEESMLRMRSVYLSMVLLAHTGMATYMEEYYAQYMNAFEAAPFIEASRIMKKEGVTPRCVGCKSKTTCNYDHRGYCLQHNIRII